MIDRVERWCEVQQTECWHLVGPNALWPTQPKFWVGHGPPGPRCSAPMPGREPRFSHDNTQDAHCKSWRRRRNACLHGGGSAISGPGGQRTFILLINWSIYVGGGRSQRHTTRPPPVAAPRHHVIVIGARHYWANTCHIQCWNWPKRTGGSDVEMFEILPRDWNLTPIFTQKWASVIPTLVTSVKQHNTIAPISTDQAESETKGGNIVRWLKRDSLFVTPHPQNTDNLSLGSLQVRILYVIQCWANDGCDTCFYCTWAWANNITLTLISYPCLEIK